jgi:signal transduction histidine kinase
MVPFAGAQIMLLEDPDCLAVRAALGEHAVVSGQDGTGGGKAWVYNLRTVPPLRQVITLGESLLIADTADYPGWEQMHGFEEVRNWLGVPLVAAGRVIGLCAISQAEPGRFTPEHIRLAEGLAAQAATAIQNAQFYAQVEQSRREQQALARRLVEAQEVERRVIARELHDESGQSLTSLLIGLGILEHDPGTPEAVAERLRELKTVANDVMEGLHRLSANLRPANLDRLGLLPAVRQLATDSQRQNGFRVELMADEMELRLSAETETMLYRVVQEALTNIARHAEATHVGILLKREPEAISVIVEDDGVGFDAEEAARSGRLGLLGMRERTEMMGGKFGVESAPGAGTTIFVNLPISRES